jgi:hypothetical protein
VLARNALDDSQTAHRRLLKTRRAASTAFVEISIGQPKL